MLSYLALASVWCTEIYTQFVNQSKLVLQDTYEIIVYIVTFMGYYNQHISIVQKLINIFT